MTPIQLVERVSDRGCAVRLIDGILAHLYYKNDNTAFCALDNVRAYLVNESHKDLIDARKNWTL